MDAPFVRFGSEIERAEGLLPIDAQRIKTLLNIYRKHIGANMIKQRYYDDEVDVSGYDSRIPDGLKEINIQTGYCAKAVDSLARRSVFDGFSMDGDSATKLDDIVRTNELDMAYSEAKTSELTLGHGYWCIVPRGVGKVPSISYHDPLEAAAEWDHRNRRIKFGMVITDLGRQTDSSQEEPIAITLHTDTNVVEIKRDTSRWEQWTATYRPHAMGEPLMVAMRYNPSRRQPFGKSRVSKASRSLVDQAILETYNLIAHSQYYAIPQKYALNLSDEQFDELQGKETKVYANEVFLGTTGEDGQPINYGALQIGGVSEHISVLTNIVQRFAAENEMPMAAFGELGNFTSSDALNATSHDLVVLATNMNTCNKAALVKVAQIALCAYQNKTMDELTEDERMITAHFTDPSMLSMSQVVDANTKLAVTVPEYAQTDVFWERNGFSEDERKRVSSQMAGNRQLSIAAKVFGGN